MHDIENVLRNSGFWIAFLAAAAGTFVVWARIRRAESEPGIAVVVVVACLAGLRENRWLSFALVVAVLLLIGGEWLTRRDGHLARMVALAPGALVIGASLPDGWPFWMRAAVATTTVVGGVLTVDADRRAARLVPMLLAIGAAGVYLCVPDTETVMTLLGALVAASVLGLEGRLRPSLGFASVVGLFAWVSAIGGLGRGGSVVGAIACLGVVLLVPLAGRLTARPWGVVLLVVVQIALVVFVSRVAGFEASTASALWLSLGAFAAAAAVLAVSARVAE